MRRSLPSRTVARNITPEARAAPASKLGGIASYARLLPDPAGDTLAMDWSGLSLPRKIVAYFREVEVHDAKAVGRISSRSGAFEQSSRHTLMVNLEGEGVVGVGGLAQGFEEGDAMLVLPGQAHYFLDLPKTFSWLFFTFEFQGQEGAAYESLRDSPRAVSRKARRILHHIIVNYAKAESAEEALQISLLLAEFLRELQECDPLNRIQSDLPLVPAIRHWVFENIEEELSLEHMAEFVGLPPSKLKDEFRRGTGDSLSVFVRDARLVWASMRLMEPGADPLAISQRCGFKSPENFAEAFQGLFRRSIAEFQEAAAR